MERDESFFAVHPATEMPSVGSDDEDSFVVLGTSSLRDDDVSLNDEVLPPIRSGKIHEMQNSIKLEISQINSSTGSIPEMPEALDSLNAVTSAVKNITLSPDSSHEEIQKQVEELIKENEKLKNIIAQNNLSMKTQYDRILAWKEDVNKVMQSYKNKFIEAKNYIDKCKEENNKLANDAEKYKKIKELQDEEIMNLKRIEKEAENLGAVSSSAEQNMIQFDLQIANEKIKDLQTELAEANIKITEYSTEKQKLIEKLVKFPVLEEELHNKEKEIEDLRTELETNKQKSLSYTDKLLKQKNQIEELQNQLANEIRKSHKLTESTSSIPSFENKLQQNELKIYQLQQEKAELQSKNKSLLDETANLRTDLLKLKQVYDPELQENYARVYQQLMGSQITITALDEDNKKKIREIEELRQLLQNNLKSDEIYALNEQLSLYKHDFEVERESKNSIKRERDQIAEDLQNLQKRNQQLQDEVEKYRPKADGFTCPKCSFGFSTYQSLENHVHRCLDLDGFP